MILQQTADLSHIPTRIVSLVPSQTELLFALELQAETIGITKFCVHPREWFNTKQRIGGTKTVNIDAVHQLKPDLIIANKEENVKEQIEELAVTYPVWLTDVNSLVDAIQMIRDIGALTGRPDNANTLAAIISRQFKEMQAITRPLKVAYLIWRNPYLAVGGNTFINDMLKQAGFENVFSGKTRYPEISIEDILAANCDLVLLSSEPYPFTQKHIVDLRDHLPGSRIMLVDGEMFSWYGSRLSQFPAYFKQLTAQIQDR